MIKNENFTQFSSTNGKVALALFRIRNHADTAIRWQPGFRHSAYSAWGERASVTINGANTFVSENSGLSYINISVPPKRVSTVIFASTSGVPMNIASGIYVRNCTLLLENIVLPDGLSFVDDLDNASGGWEQ